MEIWIASSNKGKISEFQILLHELGPVKLHVQSEINGFHPRPEDGKTFLENAQIKARTLKAVRPEAWIIADDSGLEVEGLGGLPGIHTARYAGPKASDSENVAKLLKMMSIRPMANRNAQFRAAVVVITPEGEEWQFEGLLKGKIATKPAGNLGFGYDPVFIPDGEDKTLAELGAGYKNMHSHRSQATKAFVQKVKSL
ncbi:MAG: RdgB/HAM1 family non-canonical purine NTP pyrophosphatase [Bdellovibrionia bacterium]